MELREITYLAVALRIFAAILFGGLIGLERGLKNRPAGLRTYMLVCVGACLIMLTNQYIYQITGTGDPVRMGAQVISGIGFLGAGPIMITSRQVKGLTTAAGLWATASIGLAIGAGFYVGALAAFIIIVLSITIFHRLEYRITKRYNRFGIYMEIRSDELVRIAIDSLKEKYRVTDIQVTSPRSGKAGNVGIEGNIHISTGSKRISPDEVAKDLETLEYVVFAIESI